MYSTHKHTHTHTSKVSGIFNFSNKKKIPQVDEIDFFFGMKLKLFLLLLNEKNNELVCDEHKRSRIIIIIIVSYIACCFLYGHENKKYFRFFFQSQRLWSHEIIKWNQKVKREREINVKKKSSQGFSLDWYRNVWNLKLNKQNQSIIHSFIRYRITNFMEFKIFGIFCLFVYLSDDS